MAGHADADTVNLHKAGYVQAADPGAIGAGLVWFDTSTNPAVIKLRNANNDGWETLTGTAAGLAPADYDSGWFAVSLSQDYTKLHGLVDRPRVVKVFFSDFAAPDGSNPVYTWEVTNPSSSLNYQFIYMTDTEITLKTNVGGYVFLAPGASRNSGYGLILAWL